MGFEWWTNTNSGMVPICYAARFDAVFQAQTQRKLCRAVLQRLLEQVVLLLGVCLHA